MTLPGRIAALAAALLFGAAAGAAGAEGPPAVEPEARAALVAALERIAAARSLSFSAAITSDAPLPSGEKIQFSGNLEVAVRRPDRLRVAFDGEQRSTRSWYDGKTFTLLDTGGNAYASCAAPADLEGLFPTMREKLGFTPPLSLLLHENVVAETLARVRSGFAVGRAVVGGVPTRHLAFRGDRVDWQVWVDEGAAPVIRRVLVTYREEPGAPQYGATFTAWDFAARHADADFAFTPPAGAVACEFESLGSGPRGGRKP